MVKIKDIPTNDRPRERLIINGPGALSNEELLSIIIKTGTKNESAKIIASNIISHIKEISNLKSITLRELKNIKGIKEAKACDILALVELSKRLYSNNILINKIKFNNPEIIFDYYKEKFKEEKQEKFYAVYLDASKKVIEDRLLFIGTVNQSMVHPRDIFKQACILDASSIICVHNHPSDNIIPSKEDINITKKLISIGELFNIPVIDHIIIGTFKYYSFYENGQI